MVTVTYFDQGVAKLLAPESLDSTFQKVLDDYSEALNEYAFEPGNLSDCEAKLIRTITQFGYLKKKSPNLYPEMVELQAFRSMVGLLKNKDCSEYLAHNILSTFKELLTDDTDIEMIMNQEQAVGEFVDLLVGYGAIPVFVSILGRFSDDAGDGDIDDADDVDFSALQTLARMMYARPDVAEIMCKQPRLVDWVLAKLKIDDAFDYRKQYAAGFLTLLLEPSTSFELGELGFVQVVVDGLLPYTSLAEDEDLLDEEEYLLDRLFECLSYLLLDLNNIVMFAKAGGVGHMIRIIKQVELNYIYYGPAVVALDLALKNCPAACDKFVDASGLDIAFVDAIRSCITHEEEEIEELLISIIASLTGGITNETNKDALLSKFDSRSTTWLMKLFKRYFNKMQEWTLEVEARMSLEMDQFELYYEKLEYGLSTLQLIAVILGFLWLSKNSKVSARIEKELSHHNLKKKDVLDILLAYRDDGIDVAGKLAKTAVIEECIDFLETQEEVLPAAHSEEQKINPVVDDDKGDGDHVSGRRRKQSRSEKKYKAMLKHGIKSISTGVTVDKKSKEYDVIADLFSQLPTEEAEQSYPSDVVSNPEEVIELVMAQAGVSRPKAVEALKANDGDIIAAIMDLIS